MSPHVYRIGLNEDGKTVHIICDWCQVHLGDIDPHNSKPMYQLTMQHEHENKDKE